MLGMNRGSVLRRMTSLRATYKSKSKSRSYQHNKYATGGASNTPDFQSLIRPLYKRYRLSLGHLVWLLTLAWIARSHPDILRASHPSSAEINEESMQILNGILSTIKTYDSPPAINKRLIFHIKNTTTGYSLTRLFTGSLTNVLNLIGL